MKAFVVALALVAGCASEPVEPPPWYDVVGYELGGSRQGMFTVGWRTVGGAAVPVNEPFALDLRVFRGQGTDEPLPGAQVFASAWMPDHSHGMLRSPRTTEVGDGAYEVRGMLFHMSGRWQLFVDVVDGGLSERVEFEIELP